MNPLLLLYNLFISLYSFFIRLAAPFNPKAKAWVEGRRNWPQRLKPAMERLHAENRPIAWIHCASLGEFEQGRPVIEALKERRPGIAVLLTFFSPSGYEIRKDYPLADHVAYLPADTRGQARTFIGLVRPTLVIFVKYEFWYHHLMTVRQQEIPLFLISAVFRPGQVFFRPWGALFRTLLRGFSRIFVQNASSASLLHGIGIRQVSVAGDTRIDRVAAIAAQPRDFPVIEAFAAGSRVLVAGSTWAPDEERLALLIREHLPPEWKIIIAPHRIDPEHLPGVERRLASPVLRYSQADTATASSHRILLIDNIGMLSGLYRYGRLAYIGGGFGAGIHNTLEPVAFGLPVIFGPRYTKFAEAVQLIDSGGAFSIHTPEQLAEVFTNLQDPASYEAAAGAARTLIKENRGATGKILETIFSLTSI